MVKLRALLIGGRLEFLKTFLDTVLHLDVHLAEWAQWMGPWLYVALFLIVFAETGLVVTPFLPGDSLLFAAGALCALPESGLHLGIMMVLLILAGIFGDAVNYSLGLYLGPKVFKQKTGRIFNQEHLTRTQRFYEKYGSKTIVLARFVPIVRTFAPFVAGVGRMKYSQFALYNVSGAIAWVVLFLGAGHFFGNVPSVKQNFHVVILAIIAISVLPIVVEFWRARKVRT